MADDTTPTVWRTHKDDSPSGPRRRRLLGVLLSVIAVGGVAVGVLLWLSPPRAAAWLPLGITTEPGAGGVPGVVPWSEQDRKALADGGWLGKPLDAVAPNPSRDAIRLRLKALAGRPVGTPVVLTLGGPAGVDSAGRAYLLAADPLGDHPRNRVALAEALELFRDCPATHKLLILDLHPLGRPGLGATPPEAVSAAAVRELERVADANRLCLLSCDAGEVPLASPGLGRTAFGHYLELGLRGAADGWNPSADRDRRVGVAELAAYVRARVGRWSETNAVAGQTPRLFGTAADFTLRPVSSDDLPDAIPATIDHALAAYPDWLKAAWEERDKLLAGPRVARTAKAVRRRTDALLTAERNWADGRPDADVQRDLARAFKDDDRLDATAAAGTPPDPAPSLAAAALKLILADATLATELKTAVLKAEARPPEPAPATPAPVVVAAPVAWPELEPLKAKPHAPLAFAAFALLADDPAPSPARLRQLDRLLAAQEVTPRFAETLLLRRLAALPADAVPPARVAQALRTARDFEDAAVVPEVAAWAGPALDEAYRRWADAQAAFLSPGYVSSEETGRRLADAASAARQLKGFADAVREADAARADALRHLGATFPAYDAGLIALPAVRPFADATRALVDSLRPPAEPFTLDTLGAIVEVWRRRAAEAREALALFTRPFRAPALALLRERAAASDASPAVAREVDAVLATGLPPATDRAALWNAALALSARLSDGVIRKDTLDDIAVAEGRTRPAYTDPRQPASTSPQSSDGPARQAAWSALLLRASGAADDRLPSLEDADAGPAARLDRVREAWFEAVPARPSEAADWVMPSGPVPVDVTAVSKPVTAPNPLRAVWAWHARRYDYEGRDPLDPLPNGPGPAFTAAAARACRQAANGSADEPFVDITPPPGVALPAEGNAVTIEVGLRLVGGAAEPLTLRTFTASPRWLQATAPATLDVTPGREQRAAVRLDVDTTRPPDPDARGTLLEATAGGRTFHRRVPVGLDAVVNKLGLLVATDPKAPPRPASDLRLRPLAAGRPHYFSLANPGPKPRTVIVRLPGFRVETPAVVVPSAGAAALAFPPPAPAVPTSVPADGTPLAPASDFRDLAGPLEFEVLEGEGRKVVQRFAVPVEVADPARYLAVTDVVFRPAAGGRPNALSVRVVPDVPLADPACPVEMGFPADRNRGLLPVRDGKLKADLPPGGTPLTLYAQNLAAAGVAAQPVLVTLMADGVERAFTFAGTLPTDGETVRLAPVTAPLVRLRAAEFATGTEPLPVRVEVDNAPEGATLDVRLGENKDDRFVVDSERVLPTAKREGAAASLKSPDGAVVLQGTLGDWDVKLPVDFLVGVRDLEARLKDAAGTVVAEARVRVVFDNAPPANVQFLALAPKARKDQPLAVRATCDPTISGLKSVRFFLGRPVKNAPPSGATPVPGQLADERANVWAGAIPVPPAAGPVTVTAEFTTKAGNKGFESQDVELVDPADFNKPEPGSIAGKATDNSLAVGGLTVILLDDKGAEKARALTKPDGSYSFPDLVPGKYRLYAERETTNRKADETVDLKAGEAKKLDLVLLL